jgi:hypothetical protein
MAAYAVSQEELAREQRLLNDARWQAEREPLRELLMRIAAASSDQDFFDIHVSLVSRLKARQQFIDELRGEADDLGRRRRELADQTPKPISELRRVQAELDDVLWSVRVQRSLHWLLLDVGDALIWRRLGFDRQRSPRSARGSAWPGSRMDAVGTRKSARLTDSGARVRSPY